MDYFVEKGVIFECFYEYDSDDKLKVFVVFVLEYEC